MTNLHLALNNAANLLALVGNLCGFLAEKKTADTISENRGKLKSDLERALSTALEGVEGGSCGRGGCPLTS